MSRFLDCFYGRSLLLEGSIFNPDVKLYTDASGAHEFGAYFQGEWCTEGWLVAWEKKGYCANLALLELFPIVLVVEIWGDRFRDKRVCFLYDNLGLVQAVNSQTADSPPVVLLLRWLERKCLLISTISRR